MLVVLLRSGHRMRIFLLTALLFALAPSATAQVEIHLVVSKKANMKGELEDLASFGLLKETTCDSDGNIYTPSNRKYGDAINSILRIAPDAKSYTQFSIDPLPKLADGHITDFVLEPSGDIYVLARQVLKYLKLEVPIQFGETFIIHYAKSGKVVSQIRLALDTNGFEPTGLAVLEAGEYLVVGFRRAGDKVIVLAQTFRLDGNMKAKLELGHEGTKASNLGSVRSLRVIHPVAIKANGSIYVMRGTTSEPIYILSESGQLRRTLLLKQPGLEFDSPHILKNDLIVNQHRPIPAENRGITFRSGPERVNLPVFDLETGESVREYYWHEETMGIACYSSREALTFIGQDVDSFPSGWALFYAKPASPAKPKGRTTP